MNTQHKRGEHLREIMEEGRIHTFERKIRIHKKILGVISGIAVIFCITAICWVIYNHPPAATEANTDRHIQRLKSPDKWVRMDAAMALETIGPNTSIAGPSLVEALNDEDAWVRRDAGYALASVARDSPELVLPALCDALKDKVPLVRADTALALGMYLHGQGDVPGVLEAVNALGDTLGDNEEIVYASAVVSLELIGSPSTHVLEKLMDTIKRNIRWIDRDTYPTQNGTGRKIVDIGSYYKDIRSDYLFARRTLFNVKRLPEFMQFIILFIDWGVMTESPPLLRYAIYAPAWIGPEPEVLSALNESLNDTNPEIRAWAADNLGLLGAAAKGSVPALINSLTDTEGNVRKAAAKALGEIGYTPESAEVLASILATDEYWWVREAAAYALAKFGEAASSARPALQKLFPEIPVGPLRIAVAAALIKTGSDPDDMLYEITDIIENRNITFRLCAIQTLGWLGTDATGALPLLRQVFHKDHPKPCSDGAGLSSVANAAEEAINRIEEAIRIDESGN